MSFSFTLWDLPEGKIGVHFKHALEQLVRAHAADLEVQRHHVPNVPRLLQPRGIHDPGLMTPKGEPTRPPTVSFMQDDHELEHIGMQLEIDSDAHKESMQKSDAKLKREQDACSPGSDGAAELEKSACMEHEGLDSPWSSPNVRIPTKDSTHSFVTSQAPTSSASEDDPKERMKSLHNLFDRLRFEEDYIDAENCQEIMVLVLGHERAPDLAETQETLTELCRHVRAISKFPAECSMEVNDGFRAFNMNVIDFDTFVYLMEWEHRGFESLQFNAAPSISFEHTVTIRYMRDSLIKYGADVLIAKYARLNLPKRRSAERHWGLKVLEPITGFVIILNSLSIGLSEEFDWSGWDTTEYVFTGFFTAEIILNMYMQGCRTFLCEPKDWAWNWFDIVVVLLAIVDVFLQQIAPNSGLSLREFTLARLARLARLTRLMRVLRLLRLKIFKELLLMVRGVVAGLRTLFWAIVLLLVLVYACAVALMQTVGSADVVIGEGDSAILLFPSLMWSMFNVFRCFMFDGDLVNGTPLVGHLEAKYGALFVLPYTFVTLFMFFGIFNLIAAIFVENVIESAKAKRELTEDADRMRVAHILRKLLFQFTSQSRSGFGKYASRMSNINTEVEVPLSRSRSASQIVKYASRVSLNIAYPVVGNDLEEFFSDTEGDSIVEADGKITRSMFTRALKDPKTLELLDDLDIQVCDRSELFDVLDADHSGEIEISEMISGLMKMRSGGADRTDIVATILGLRAVQNSMRELKDEFQLVYEHFEKNRSHLEIQHANYLDIKHLLGGLDRKLQDRGTD